MVHRYEANRLSICQFAGPQAKAVELQAAVLQLQLLVISTVACAVRFDWCESLPCLLDIVIPGYVKAWIGGKVPQDEEIIAWVYVSSWSSSTFIEADRQPSTLQRWKKQIIIRALAASMTSLRLALVQRKKFNEDRFLAKNSAVYNQEEVVWKMID